MKRLIPSLSGLSIIAVVLHHGTNWGFIAMFWWAHRYRPVQTPNYEQLGSSSYYGLVIFNQLALFSVPAFLFIAGVFVSYASSASPRRIGWTIISNRLKWLLIPYLIWSILIFILDGLQGDWYSPIEYLEKIIKGDAVGAYFFIPLLAQFYLVSPWLVKWADKRPYTLLAISFIVTFALMGIPYFAIHSNNIEAVYIKVRALDWTFVRWSFFFVLGLVLGIKWTEVSAWFAAKRKSILLLTILFAFLSIIESEWIYQTTSVLDWSHTPLKFSSAIYATLFILMFFTSRVIPRKLTPLIATIGSMSYGIYLIHPKTVIVTSRIIYHLAPWMLGKQYFLQPILLIVSLMVPIAIMRLVSISRMKPVYRFLFG